MAALKVGQRVPLELTDLAAGGEAVGRTDGFVVFVENGLPGDSAEVEIIEVKKSYARGRVEHLTIASPQRIEPPCPIYADCGGCQLQHLSYDGQLDAKTRIVADAMRNIAGLRDVPVERCLPTPQWGYRNKIQLVAARGARLGLYRRNTHRVVPMDECRIAHPLTNRIVAAATPIIMRCGWAAYDERSGKGLLRHVLVRVAGPPGQEEALVVVIATQAQVPHLQRFARLMMEQVPQVVGIMLNVNGERGNVILGRRTMHVAGRDHLVETVRGVQFRIGATSFFQVNTAGLALLSELVEDFLQPRPQEEIVDGYCGVGAFSLLLARKVARVHGIEEVAEAVDNARHNALLNGITNAEFHCGTVESLLASIPRVDAAVLDPPRKGCLPAVVETLAARRVTRIVYVSCNPATLARDLALLVGHGYRATRIQPVDMFPQTSHVECVVRIQDSSADDGEDT